MFLFLPLRCSQEEICPDEVLEEARRSPTVTLLPTCSDSGGRACRHTKHSARSPRPPQTLAAWLSVPHCSSERASRTAPACLSVPLRGQQTRLVRVTAAAVAAAGHHRVFCVLGPSVLCGTHHDHPTFCSGVFWNLLRVRRTRENPAGPACRAVSERQRGMPSRFAGWLVEDLCISGA